MGARRDQSHHVIGNSRKSVRLRLRPAQYLAEGRGSYKYNIPEIWRGELTQETNQKLVNKQRYI